MGEQGRLMASVVVSSLTVLVLEPLGGRRYDRGECSSTSWRTLKGLEVATVAITGGPCNLFIGASGKERMVPSVNVGEVDSGDVGSCRVSGSAVNAAVAWA